MEKVILYGTGKHAEIVYYYLVIEAKYEVVAFTVEEKYLTKPTLFDLPILPFEHLKQLLSPDDHAMFIAIGPQRLNRAREEHYTESKKRGYKLINWIGSNALFSPDLIIGDNTFIGHGTGIHPFVRIGNDVSLIDAKIGHHCQIGNHVFISNAILGGSVTIEDNVFIGMGSIIKENTTIGKGSIIGMGSIIKEDVEPYSVYAPAGTAKRNISSKRISIF